MDVNCFERHKTSTTEFYLCTSESLEKPHDYQNLKEAGRSTLSAQSACAKLAKGLPPLKVFGETHVCEFGSMLHLSVFIHYAVYNYTVYSPYTVHTVHMVQYKLMYHYTPNVYIYYAHIHTHICHLSTV